LAKKSQHKAQRLAWPPVADLFHDRYLAFNPSSVQESLYFPKPGKGVLSASIGADLVGEFFRDQGSGHNDFDLSSHAPFFIDLNGAL